jgi:hypothetical protein
MRVRISGKIAHQNERHRLHTGMPQGGGHVVMIDYIGHEAGPVDHRHRFFGNGHFQIVTTQHLVFFDFLPHFAGAVRHLGGAQPVDIERFHDMSQCDERCLFCLDSLSQTMHAGCATSRHRPQLAIASIEIALPAFIASMRARK